MELRKYNKEYETITLTYSLDEMILYLRIRGYTVEEINVYELHSVYHNDVEHEDGTMMIAYQGDHPYPNNIEKPVYNSLIKQEVFLVFRDELRKSLLNI